MPRSYNPHGRRTNHPDQPRDCFVCGNKIKATDNAWFHFDDTKAREHRSWHAECAFPAIKKAPA